jgi:predicted transport protein
LEKQKVGRVINFRGLTYAPVNEQGVVFLFSKVNDDLGIKIESIQDAFPDAVGIDYRHNREMGIRKKIEFEFRSSKYDHPIEGCDIIVCWEHDWRDYPETIEVIELRSELEKLSLTRPTVPKEVESFIESRRPRGDIEEVFRKLIQEIERISNRITRKIKKTTVSYKTTRSFVAVELQKTLVRLHLTLPKAPREKNVEYLRKVHGNKWHGHLIVRNLNEAEAAVEICKKAYDDTLR